MQSSSINSKSIRGIHRFSVSAYVFYSLCLLFVLGKKEEIVSFTVETSSNSTCNSFHCDQSHHPHNESLPLRTPPPEPAKQSHSTKSLPPILPPKAPSNILQQAHIWKSKQANYVPLRWLMQNTIHPSTYYYSLNYSAEKFALHGRAHSPSHHPPLSRELPQ